LDSAMYHQEQAYLLSICVGIRRRLYFWITYGQRDDRIGRRSPSNTSVTRCEIIWTMTGWRLPGRHTLLSEGSSGLRSELLHLVTSSSKIGAPKVTDCGPKVEALDLLIEHYEIEAATHGVVRTGPYRRSEGASRTRIVVLSGFRLVALPSSEA